MRSRTLFSLGMLIAIMITVGSLSGQIVSKDSPLASIYYKQATFAGGCFWCMEPPFEALDGVVDVVSGYSGGHVKNPSYKQVTSGKTGHLEVVQVSYDPQVVSYETLLETFWKNIDPTDGGGQFADRGSQYHTAIFYHNEDQRLAAERSKKILDESGKFKARVATRIMAFDRFYPAEDYHQDFYEKNPSYYNRYKQGSGRSDYLKKTWEQDTKTFQKIGQFEKPDEHEIRKMLNPLQFKVTQECGTEPAFNNAYWNNKQPGIYVDVVSGEPLFSSRDKYDSGTGWPSFSKPLEQENIREKEDRSLFMTRTEVRSKHGDSHLGHLFNDGPPSTGMRYCINSASLRFIPLEKMEAEGYGDYVASVVDKNSGAHR